MIEGTEVFSDAMIDYQAVAEQLQAENERLRLRVLALRYDLRWSDLLPERLVERLEFLADPLRLLCVLLIFALIVGPLARAFAFFFRRL